MKILSNKRYNELLYCKAAHKADMKQKRYYQEMYEISLNMNKTFINTIGLKEGEFLELIKKTYCLFSIKWAEVFWQEMDINMVETLKAEMEFSKKGIKSDLFGE